MLIISVLSDLVLHAPFLYSFYCEIIFSYKTLNFVYFVSKILHDFKFQKNWFCVFVWCWKYLNSRVHKHVHHYHQNTKLCAHDIKWFHSIANRAGLILTTSGQPVFQEIWIIGHIEEMTNTTTII